jgi:toxin ParE1/3/4
MRVFWLPRARRQREYAIEYIRRDNPRAALAVLDRIHERVHSLAEHPYIGRPGMRAGTRELVIPRTPYIIVYTVDDAVRVLALYHHAQQWPDDFL